ncbi:MAG: phosphate acetyltransferase [Deltaproteobacteria bacterium]|jgi:phosphate acetyltransferase|nr:phosphate acetyltransferase [Deltaproteobacteria bacterium]
MVTCVFVASDVKAEKIRFLDSLRNFCAAGAGGGGGCGGGGYFKTIAAAEDDSRLREISAKLKTAPEDLYGIRAEEAILLLNRGKEAEIIERVLSKFFGLSQRFSQIPVEGADLDSPLAFDLQGLDAVLAANLAAPVVAVSSSPSKALSLRRHYLDKGAEVILVALLGKAAGPELEALENLGPGFLAVGGYDELAAKFGDLAGAVHSFKPSVLAPKRFEFELVERARADKKTIVLPEGDDDRILQAADDILRRGFASIVILGDESRIRKRAGELGLGHLDQAELLKVESAPFRGELVNLFAELRKAKGVTPEQADKQLNDRNWFGTMMVKSGRADGMVSGAAGSTADTIRPALSLIKTRPGCSIASSVFLMCMKDRVLVFGDCAIVTNPTPAQLAEIAVMSARTAAAFGVEPRVGLLSYSTGSSGAGPDVDAVTEAVALAKKNLETQYPGLALDGPMQFDAALDPKTAASKMPGSPVAGKATVLIFPSLNAGNIGYKAVQRTSGAVAVGPVIQGLNAPVNDLSRGCTVPDIINTVAITACQAQAG